MSDTTSSSSRMGSTPAQTPNILGLNQNSLNSEIEISGGGGGASVGAIRSNNNNPLFIPNIPQPVNGMIKTYDTTHRSFTRPYSAKTVFFYREGDNYFSGVRVPISKSRYRNMDSLLDDLNSNIPLPFGVRRLHTPFGRTPITSIEQLQHLGKYVASSSKIGRPMDIDAVEKHQQKMREIAQKRWEKFNSEQQSAGSSARLLLNNNNGEKWKSRTLGLFLPLRAKQLFFILNGNPGRIYRVIINPYRKFDFDTVLEEVSHGLGIAIWKLYSFTGERIKNAEELFDIKENRVLAVPRHERPIFPTGIHKESSASSVASAAITSSLPPINRSNLFHHPPNNNNQRQPMIGRTTTTHYALKLPARQPQAIGVRNNHSIERSPIGRDSRIPVAPAAIVPARRTFSYHKPAEARPFIPQMASTSRTRVAPPIQPFAKGAQNRRVMSLKPRRTLPYQQANRMGLPASTLLAGAAATAKPSTATSKGSSTASVEENDSDSGRPRSTDFEEATEDQSESDSDNALRYEEEESDDDDYPDVHLDVLSRHDSLESPPPSRASNASKSPPDTAAQTPGSSRRTSGISVIPDDKRRNEAATTIQKHVRGHLTRKRIKPLLGAAAVTTVASDDTVEATDDEIMMAENEAESESEFEKDDEDKDDDESNDGRRNAAAVTIQKHIRGHLTRKHIKAKHRPATPGAPTMIIDGDKNFEDDDYSEAEQSEHSDASHIDVSESEAEQSEHSITPHPTGALESESEAEQSEYDDLPDDEDSERRHEAATTIQKNWKGYYVRKNLDKIIPVGIPLPSEEEAAFEESFENDEGEIRLETAAPAGDPTLNGESGFTYTAAIFTGNRWAADTESDLYIILYGDEGESEKHFLRQDFINWLQSDDPKFKQGKTDEFVIATQNLGQLRKITLGHSHTGYGGGVFIDQIIITDNSEEESKRYLFQCYKWFDSGQVDGKLERTLNCTATYYIGSANTSKSKGRWELLLHNGNDVGEGGTTSNLNIFGYGVNGMSRSVDIYDSTLANVPSVSLIQVDFGQDIGDLIKMRIEIDGNGTKPDYFLDFVEMKDIDTDERIEINVNSWLKWESKEKGAQAFRELVIFRGSSDTLPCKFERLAKDIFEKDKVNPCHLQGNLEVYTYEGKMRIIPSQISLCSPSIKLEICGENGESGIFPASIANSEGKKDKFDVSFRVEAVSVGRVLAMRVYFDPTLEGEVIFEGLAEMQKLLDKTGLEASVGMDFLISYIIVRESHHAPYRTVLGQSRIQPRRDNIPDDSYVKELRMSSMEGLSTKLPKKKAIKKKTPTWIVSIILEEESSLLPMIVLCGEKSCQKMKCMDLTPNDSIIGYQLKDAQIGELRKIRVSIDHGQRLNQSATPDDDEEEADLQETLEKNRTFIKKIRVVDAVNGDELRFPVANIEMFQYSVFEFPAIWPDVPPLSNVNYEITISTGESKYSVPFYVHINIYGEFGDTGFRFLGEEHPQKLTEFPHDSQNVFSLEAVSLGEITKIDIQVDNYIDDFVWECQEVVIPDPLNIGVFYAFRLNQPFSPNLLLQSAVVSSLTDSL